MKIKTNEWKSVEKELSIEEAVEQFFDECSVYYNDWDETSYELEDFIDNIDDISDSEKASLTEAVKKKFNMEAEKLRQEEIRQLDNRRLILSFLTSINFDENDWDINEGDIGYMLSAEEILDLILKNGNK